MTDTNATTDADNALIFALSAFFDGYEADPLAVAHALRVIGDTVSYAKLGECALLCMIRANVRQLKQRREELLRMVADIPKETH